MPYVLLEVLLHTYALIHKAPRHVRSLRPAKVHARHLVELAVEWPIELAQSIEGDRIDCGMAAALRLSKAMWTRFA